MMMSVVRLGLVFLATGCLARSLAVDTQAIVVVWELDDRTPLGCLDGGVDLPVLKIRSHIQASPDPDDEYFDWVPCRIDDPIPEQSPFRGLTTPLELGAYDVEVELWTPDRARVLARSTGPRTAVLDNTPPEPYEVSVVLAPVLPVPPTESGL